MNWIATKKDGSTVKQVDGNLFKDLELNEVDKIRLYENPYSIVVPFHGETGELLFNNLQYEELMKMTGEEELKFEFDPITKIFRMDKNSLDLYNRIMSLDEKVYNYTEIGQSGEFLVSDKQVWASYNIASGEIIEFKNSPPITNFFFLATGNIDVRVRGTKILNRKDRTSHYQIGYEKDYEYEGLVFKTKQYIEYDIVLQAINFFMVTSCSEKVNGQFVLHYGDKEVFVRMNLDPGQNYVTKKNLTSMV